MREIIKVVSLFSILVIIVLTPLLVIDIQNKQLLHRVNTEDFLALELTYDNSDNSINTLERLRIILNTIYDKSGITTINEQKLSLDEHRLVLNEADNQIEILQKLGFLPIFEVTNTKSAFSIQKTTYTDSSALNKDVTVFDVNINYEDYSVYLLLDMHTSKAYYVSLINNKENADLYKQHFDVMNFISYLEIDEQSHISKLDEQEENAILYFEDLDFCLKIHHYKESLFIEFGVQLY